MGAIRAGFRARALVGVLVVALLASACSSNPAGSTEILWDRWGTPHVYAPDSEGLFRAFGWAQTRSHGNLLLRLLAQGRGEAAALGGETFVESDRAVHVMGLRERGAQWYVEQSAPFRRNIDAFAAGINSYVDDHEDQLDERFRAVVPITGQDVLAHVARIVFLFVSQASGCDFAVPGGARTGPGDIGSNAWAIGPERTAAGNPLLLINPHLAWGGEQVLTEAHLVTPEVDVYGAAFVGFPVLSSGFTERHGWAHTVNPIDGCDIYQLVPLGEGYLFDGTVAAYETRTHLLQVRQPDGTMREEPILLRRSIHGPVVSKHGFLGAVRITAVGQTSTPGLLEQWWQMARARSLEEFGAALRGNQLPMFNVIYADRDKHVGAAYAGQVPVRPPGYAGSWRELVPGDTSATLWNQVHPFDELPRVVDPPGGFVQNSNSPPWSFTYPGVAELDPRRYPADLAPPFLNWRERRGLRMISETPRMSLDDLVRLKHSTRMELADRVLPELIDAARRSDSTITREAAGVLASWDRGADADSTGAGLFLAWVLAALPDGTSADGLFRVPVDLADPLNTPNTLADPAGAVAALTAAANRLQDLAGGLAVPWGDVARLERGGVDLPANGFPGDPYGVFRVLAPDLDLLGYGKPSPITFGDSFVAAVEFSTPPRARVLMTYGNSTQPASPHLGDQLRLSAQGVLREAWLTRADIEAHLEDRTVLR